MDENGRIGVRLLYISSGSGFAFSPTMTDEDANIINAFRKLEGERKGFKLHTFFLKKEAPERLLPRIQAFRPDVILVFKGFRFPHSIVRKIRGQGFRIGIWLVDDPYRLKTHRTLVGPYSFVLTQEASCVPFYRKMGKPCIHMPLAVETDKYFPLYSLPRKYRSDICFVGSGFPVRIHMLDRLAPYLKSKRFLIVGQWWNRLKSYPVLKRGIINRPIPPSEVVKYYNGAKIVLNIHRTHNDRGENYLNLPAITPNNRTFEIAACGAFQLASARQDMPRYYRQNQLVTFNGWKDLQKKMDYYLRHPHEREKTAKRAYEQTIVRHTYVVRLTHLIKKLNEYVKQTRRKNE